MALRDRDSIHAYIARTSSPTHAHEWLSRVKKTIENIERYPQWSRVINDRGDRERLVPGTKPRSVIRYRYQPRTQRIRRVRLFRGGQHRP
jgi:plasmid stabilization system protein ParE